MRLDTLYKDYEMFYRKSYREKEIKSLEEIFLSLTQDLFSNIKSHPLARVLNDIKFERQIPLINDQESSYRLKVSECKSAVKIINQPSLNLIGYRPEIIKRLKDTKEVIEKELKNTKKIVEEFTKFKRKWYLPSYVFIKGFDSYFSLNNYHDILAYQICVPLSEMINQMRTFVYSDETYEKSVKAWIDRGFEHIMWSNICQRAIERIRKITMNRKLDTLILPSYPDEFFHALLTLDIEMPLIKDMEFPKYVDALEETLTNFLRVGGFSRFGLSSFNEQKVKEKCRQYLTLLPPRISRLIEDYY